MEFYLTEYVSLLKQEADDKYHCAQNDPHCQKIQGNLCERGCFEITIDLQTMTIKD